MAGRVISGRAMAGRVINRKIMRSIPVLLASALAPGTACETSREIDLGTQSFRIDVVKVGGSDPPIAEIPLPANTGNKNEIWDVEVQAIGPDGGPIDFEGVVRVTVEPGAVVSVEGPEGEDLGRSLRLTGGKATGKITVTAVYGEARVWVEDLGYLPAEPGTTPLCANGKNDDGDEDSAVDYPSDPGCAFADDDTETVGTFAAGVSGPVHYALPTVQDVQGLSAATPYPFEAITINTSGVHNLVVTRISKDGFYVTDLSGQVDGYNHLFAFNFSTPRGMRVCDRVTYLTGTVSEFFGFTEVNFPSFDVEPLFEGEEDKCTVPPAAVLEPTVIASPIEMEKLESGLVRIQGYRVAKKFGPKPAVNNVFGEDSSNCDLNGDGKVDFESESEAACGNGCSADTECAEWTGFISRGNYKVYKAELDMNGTEISRSVIQVQTDGAPAFNPRVHRGEVIDSVTGSLRNFSGGDLNWTIEARCPDDVVCAFEGCEPEEKGPKEACVSLRTIDDNDQGTN